MTSLGLEQVLELDGARLGEYRPAAGQEPYIIHDAGIGPHFSRGKEKGRINRPSPLISSVCQTQPVGFGKPPYLLMGFIGPVIQVLNISFWSSPTYLANLRIGGTTA